MSYQTLDVLLMRHLSFLLGKYLDVFGCEIRVHLGDVRKWLSQVKRWVGSSSLVV
jgi:hypothetical protein